MADTLDDYRNFYETVGYKYDEPDVDSTLQAYRDFYETEGYSISGPSDANLAADVANAKAAAVKAGNKSLADYLDFILKYGDRALTILTKNGIIENKNLTAAGYSFKVISDGTTTGTTDTTNNAPNASNRVLNVDFTDPKVLIICFLLMGIAVYFIAGTGKKTAKR